MKTRHMRLSPAAIQAHNEKELATVCRVPNCGRPADVKAKLDGGLVKVGKWCKKHKRARHRPLDNHPAPPSDAIPDAVKSTRCVIPLCRRMAEVERSIRLIRGVPTPGWLVRAYCKIHRLPVSRPCGWLPGDLAPEGISTRLAERHVRAKIARFLGIGRWQDRGALAYSPRLTYRLRVNAVLHYVYPNALEALQTELEKEWGERRSLGDFAARYNLAVVAVVGATLALYEFQE